MRAALLTLSFLTMTGCASVSLAPDPLKLSQVCQSSGAADGSVAVVRVYGGRRNEGFAGGQSLAADGAGNYLVGGITQGLGSYAGNADLLLAKFLTTGETQWVRIFGGPSIDLGKAFIRTSDGGQLQAGETFGHRHTGMGYLMLGMKHHYLLLVKTDAQGLSEWHQLYVVKVGDNYRDSDMYSVLQAADGGYAFSGSTGMNPTGKKGSKMLYSDVLLAKVDASGNVEWARTYGAGGPDEAYGSTLAADGYLLAGVYSPVPGKEAADALLLKTSATGDLDWAKTFGGSKRNFFFSAVQTADGGYAAAGHTNGFGEGGKDILLIKLDEQGELLWARTYGGPEDESATSLLQTSDGGFAVVGDTSSFGDEESDAVILKTDGAGNLEWASAFGGPEAESSMSVIEPSPGNLTVLGVTQSYGAGKMDIFLLELPEGRKSDDCTKAISPIQSTPNLTVAEPSLSSALVELEKLSDSLRKQQIATFE